MQFDARAAKLLQPGAHIMVDGSPGLRLVATASKRTWTYRYKSPVDGRMRQIALGQWPAMSLASAIVRWEALRKERDAGADPAAAKRVAKTSVKSPAAKAYTVRDLCDDYLVGHIKQHRAAKGAKEVERLFTQKLDAIAGKQAATVTRAEAFNLLSSWADTPVSTGQLRSELAGAWDYALDAARIPENTPNWWRLIMRGRLRSKGKVIEGKHIGAGKRVLSELEVGQVIRWLPNFAPTTDDMLTLYLWTCTRGAEISAMEAAEISEEEDGLWWTVPKAKTKNARHQLATDLRVPLVGRAASVVRRRLEATPAGYLFPSKLRGRHIEQKAAGIAVHARMPYSNREGEENRPRLPVTRWAPHDLRRTSRTLLASLGCPDSVAEAILGHMQPGVQGIYNRHGYDRERRQWLVALDVKLEALAVPPKA